MVNVSVQKFIKLTYILSSAGKKSNETVMTRLRKCDLRLAIKSLNGQVKRIKTQNEFI